MLHIDHNYRQVMGTPSKYDSVFDIPMSSEPNTPQPPDPPQRRLGSAPPGPTILNPSNNDNSGGAALSFPSAALDYKPTSSSQPIISSATSDYGSSPVTPSKKKGRPLGSFKNGISPVKPPKIPGRTRGRPLGSFKAGDSPVKKNKENKEKKEKVVGKTEMDKKDAKEKKKSTKAILVEGVSSQAGSGDIFANAQDIATMVDGGAQSTVMEDITTVKKTVVTEITGTENGVVAETNITITKETTMTDAQVEGVPRDSTKQLNLEQSTPLLELEKPPESMTSTGSEGRAKISTPLQEKNVNSPPSRPSALQIAPPQAESKAADDEAPIVRESLQSPFNGRDESPISPDIIPFAAPLPTNGPAATTAAPGNTQTTNPARAPATAAKPIDPDETESDEDLPPRKRARIGNGSTPSKSPLPFEPDPIIGVDVDPGAEEMFRTPPPPPKHAVEPLTPSVAQLAFDDPDDTTITTEEIPQPEMDDIDNDIFAPAVPSSASKEGLKTYISKKRKRPLNKDKRLRDDTPGTPEKAATASFKRTPKEQLREEVQMSTTPTSKKKNRRSGDALISTTGGGSSAGRVAQETAEKEMDSFDQDVPATTTTSQVKTRGRSRMAVSKSTTTSSSSGKKGRVIAVKPSRKSLPARITPSSSDTKKTERRGRPRTSLPNLSTTSTAKSKRRPVLDISKTDKSDLDTDDEDVFTIAEIVDKKVEQLQVPSTGVGKNKKGGSTGGGVVVEVVKYLVHWKGYDKKKDYTWEPESNLDCEKLIMEFEKKQKGKEEVEEMGGKGVKTPRPKGKGLEEKGSTKKQIGSAKKAAAASREVKFMMLK